MTAEKSEASEKIRMCMNEYFYYHGRQYFFKCETQFNSQPCEFAVSLTYMHRFEIV